MENNFLLDTNILIDLLRRYEPAVKFLGELETVYVSTITPMELIQGASNKIELNAILSFNKNLEVIEISERISKEANEVMRKYFLETQIEVADAIIAATAIVNHRVLLTRNIKHFKKIEGLSVKDPY